MLKQNIKMLTTKKVGGSLSINFMKLTVEAEKFIYISEDDLNNPQMQMILNMGLMVIVDVLSDDKEVILSNYCKLQNITGSDVMINSLKLSLKPNTTVYVSRKIENSDNIKELVKAQKIAIVSLNDSSSENTFEVSDEPQKEIKEESKNNKDDIEDIFSEEDKKESERENKEYQQKYQDELNKTKTSPAIWDISKKQSLNIDEAKKATFKQRRISEEESPSNNMEVQVGNIDFNKKEKEEDVDVEIKVVDNVKKEINQEVNQEVEITKQDDLDKKEVKKTDKKSKKINPAGRKRKAPDPTRLEDVTEILNNSEEISFDS